MSQVAGVSTVRKLLGGGKRRGGRWSRKKKEGGGVKEGGEGLGWRGWRGELIQ